MVIATDRFRSSILDSKTGCLTSGGFKLILAREVAVAQRYGYYFTLLLIRLPHEKGKTCSHKAIELVVRKVRRSDCVAHLGDQTVGVILQHSSAGVAQKVIRRLRSEGLSAFSERVSFTSVVYPTEANTAAALQALAVKRLKAAASPFRPLNEAIVQAPPSFRVG